MKTEYLIILILLKFLSICTYSQDDKWFYQYPRNTSNTINSSIVLSDSKILLGADAGRLMILSKEKVESSKKISDYNIIVIEKADSETLYSLTYSNYLYGFRNQILKSVDGGETWIELYTYNDHLQDLCVVDSLTIIAISIESKIIVSNNGGINWGIYQLPTKYKDFYSITKTEDGILYIGGNQRALLQSTDHGKTWSVIEYNNLPYSIFGIESIANTKEIIISGDDGKVVKYSEKDSIFTDMSTNYYGYQISCTRLINNEIFAIAQQSSYTGEKSSSLLKYDSTNNSWIEISDFDFWIINALEHSESTLLLYGEVGSIGILNIKEEQYQTIDSDVRNNIVGISFINENVGWALSEKGEILKTNDSGDNWDLITKLDHDINVNRNRFLNIDFINENEGWVTRHLYDTPILFKTINGGKTWISINSTNYFGRYRAMYFLNSNTGWIARDPANILKTEDGGINWNNYGIDQFNYSQQSIEKLYFLNESIGYAAGGYISGLTDYGTYNYNALILKTIDGGANWDTLLDTKSGSYLKSICFVDEINGYAIDNSIIYKTSDGGITWLKSSIDRAILNSIYFLTPEEGWITGWQGGIYKTNNGGISWEKQPGLTNNSISETVAVEDSLIWFAGKNGTIIRFGVPSSVDTTIDNQDHELTIKLYQNYPNPFNLNTNIKYYISEDAIIKLTVFNIIGQKIENLIDGYIEKGENTIEFKGMNYTSGVYFIVLNVGDKIQAEKIVLIK